MPPPTTPSEPRLPASLDALSADDPDLRDPHELAGVELQGATWAGLVASGLRIDEDAAFGLRPRRRLAG